MAAYRVYDIFNAKIGTTQVVGAESFEVTHGFRTQTANTDGAIGASARDRSHFFSNSVLRCQSLMNFGTLLALWEAAENSDVLAEGKLAGSAVKSVSLTHKRTKLAGASLSFQQGGYATTSFNMRGSAAAASTKPSDEVTVVEVATKTITHATGLRGVRVTGASFTPLGGSAITALGVLGIDLNIAGQVDQAAGDDEFGEIAEVSGYELTGALTFKDLTLTTGATVSDLLLVGVPGALVVAFATQGGGAAGTLTLNNLAFEEETVTLAARKFHANALKFGQFFQVGATNYTLATGASKLIAVA